MTGEEAFPLAWLLLGLLLEGWNMTSLLHHALPLPAYSVNEDVFLLEPQEKKEAPEKREMKDIS